MPVELLLELRVLGLVFPEDGRGCAPEFLAAERAVLLQQGAEERKMQSKTSVKMARTFVVGDVDPMR